MVDVRVTITPKNQEFPQDTVAGPWSFTFEGNVGGDIVRLQRMSMNNFVEIDLHSGFYSVRAERLDAQENTIGPVIVEEITLTDHAAENTNQREGKFFNFTSLKKVFKRNGKHSRKSRSRG